MNDRQLLQNILDSARSYSASEYPKYFLSLLVNNLQEHLARPPERVRPAFANRGDG